MVSIRKYLEMRNTDAARPPSHGPTVPVSLCTGILNHIGAYILTGETGVELNARLEQVLADLTSDVAGDGNVRAAEQIDNLVRSALATHSTRQREAAQRLAIETQHVVGVLNHALMALVGGSARSVSRLKRIQDSLQRTAQIRDVDALRDSLGEAMKLIEDETRHEQEHSQRDLAAFESEVVTVRENLFANTVRRLPGRSEALLSLTEILVSLEAGASLCLVAQAFDNFRAVTQRYGPEPIDEIFFQAIRERIQPLSPISSSWQWSPSCIVSAFIKRCGIIELQSEVAERSRAPLLHRMRLGSRTAVLKVGMSHLALIATPASSGHRGVIDPAVIEQIDRFAGSGQPWPGQGGSAH